MIETGFEFDMELVRDDARNMFWHGEIDDAVWGLIGDLTRTVDALRARVTNRHEWPKATPTGFVYEQPKTYQALLAMLDHMAQSEVESWSEAERPPEPIWELVTLATKEVDRLQGLLHEVDVAVSAANSHRFDFNENQTEFGVGGKVGGPDSFYNGARKVTWAVRRVLARAKVRP
ncbi:hypothetical protein [Rhodococcoides fascians]|uniref:hypothetical protein n=1 Tax=Rhodococcoides fascians TaxID=1828 RepID=UPI000AA3BA11|nr:hypothetical protein [Rhodococcus fascians]